MYPDVLKRWAFGPKITERSSENRECQREYLLRKLRGHNSKGKGGVHGVFVLKHIKRLGPEMGFLNVQWEKKGSQGRKKSPALPLFLDWRGGTVKVEGGPKGEGGKYGENKSSGFR